jgi:hypothetical protein
MGERRLRALGPSGAFFPAPMRAWERSGPRIDAARFGVVCLRCGAGGRGASWLQRGSELGPCVRRVALALLSAAWRQPWCAGCGELPALRYTCHELPAHESTEKRGQARAGELVRYASRRDGRGWEQRLSASWNMAAVQSPFAMCSLGRSMLVNRNEERRSGVSLVLVLSWQHAVSSAYLRCGEACRVSAQWHSGRVLTLMDAPRISHACRVSASAGCLARRPTPATERPGIGRQPGALLSSDAVAPDVAPSLREKPRGGDRGAGALRSWGAGFCARHGAPSVAQQTGSSGGCVAAGHIGMGGDLGFRSGHVEFLVAAAPKIRRQGRHVIST